MNRLDFEALFPFPVFATLIGLMGVVQNPRGLLVIALWIIGMGQFMVLTRTMSRPIKRGEYLLVMNWR